MRSTVNIEHVKKPANFERNWSRYISSIRFSDRRERGQTMSFCKKEGKDRIIFTTKEDHEKPSTVVLPEDDDDEPGLILPSGEINWSCPCLGGMATGPCGMEFRDAFTCFHYSEADPKGSDCFGAFKGMQECMLQYPKLYPVSAKSGGGDDGDDDDKSPSALMQDADQVAASSSEKSRNSTKSGGGGDESKPTTTSSSSAGEGKKK